MTWPFLFVAALYSLNPVTISVYPQFSHSPATFRITVLAPRHEANRKVCWEVDGPEKKGSCIDLAGVDARRVWTVYWTLRTPGSYEASAVVTRMEEGRARTYSQKQAFKVLGMGVGIDEP